MFLRGASGSRAGVRVEKLMVFSIFSSSIGAEGGGKDHAVCEQTREYGSRNRGATKSRPHPPNDDHATDHSPPRSTPTTTPPLMTTSRPRRDPPVTPSFSPWWNSIRIVVEKHCVENVRGPTLVLRN